MKTMDVTCERAQVTREEAAPRTIGDVMLRNPKTLHGSATVDDARGFFANPNVVSAVVVDGTRFVGLLDRSDLPSLLPGSAPIRSYARSTPIMTPSRPVTEAMGLLDERGLSRMAIVDEDGTTLAGLLCLDRQRAGFCQG